MAIHVSRKALLYSAEQLFDLVLDVERYPSFVPWWEFARVRDRQPDSYRTDQIVKFEIIRQQFSSLTTFERPWRIDVQSEGRFFKAFDMHWRFVPTDNGCDVDLTADIAVAARPLQKLVERASREAIRVLLDAFEREAQRLFAPAEVLLAS